MLDLRRKERFSGGNTMDMQIENSCAAVNVIDVWMTITSLTSSNKFFRVPADIVNITVYIFDNFIGDSGFENDVPISAKKLKILCILLRQFAIVGSLLDVLDYVRFIDPQSSKRPLRGVCVQRLLLPAKQARSLCVYTLVPRSNIPDRG